MLAEAYVYVGYSLSPVAYYLPIVEPSRCLVSPRIRGRREGGLMHPGKGQTSVPSHAESPENTRIPVGELAHPLSFPNPSWGSLDKRDFCS